MVLVREVRHTGQSVVRHRRVGPMEAGKSGGTTQQMHRPGLGVHMDAVNVYVFKTAEIGLSQRSDSGRSGGDEMTQDKFGKEMVVNFPYLSRRRAT